MRRPPNLAFARDDAVPASILLLSGLQHVALILGVGLALPLLVLQSSGLDPDRQRDMLSFGMLALAIGTLLQVRAGRHVGSGYLIPATFTAVYLAPCISAMNAGGPSLVMGMLLFGGVLQAVTALGLGRLRAYLPPEIGGLAVLLIGFTLGLLGVRMIMLSTDGALPVGLTGNPPWLGAVTLAAIVALGVWAKPGLRTYATLVGIAVAGLAAVIGGVIVPGAVLAQVIDGGVRVPVPTMPTLSFDWTLAPEFAVCAVINSLRGIGDIVTAQRVEDADWVRPDMSSVRRGVFTDGIATSVAALLGSPIGLNTFSGSVGLAAATGITARRIGWAIAAMLFVIALLPGIAGMFLALPRPILGGVLLVSAAHIVLNGMLVITGRMLDARRVQMIGFSLLVGTAYEVMPQVFATLPQWAQLLTRSSLMVAVLCALLLNLVFRLGVRRSASVTTRAETLEGAALSDWVTQQGGAWGARPDVMHRVSGALTEIADARGELLTPDGEVRIDLSFDEYHVDMRIEYDGEPVDLSDTAPVGPGDLDTIDIDRLQARLRAGLIRGLASSVDVRESGLGRQQLHMRFEH
jgi:xanthine/uracil permease